MSDHTNCSYCAFSLFNYTYPSFASVVTFLLFQTSTKPLQPSRLHPLCACIYNASYYPDLDTITPFIHIFFSFLQRSPSTRHSFHSPSSAITSQHQQSALLYLQHVSRSLYTTFNLFHSSKHGVHNSCLPISCNPIHKQIKLPWRHNHPCLSTKSTLKLLPTSISTHPSLLPCSFFS